MESRFASTLSISDLMGNSLFLSRERPHVLPSTGRPVWYFPCSPPCPPGVCSPAVRHASDSLHFPLLLCQLEFTSFFLKVFQSILQKSQPTKEHFKDLLSALCKS